MTVSFNQTTGEFLVKPTDSKVGNGSLYRYRRVLSGPAAEIISRILSSGGFVQDPEAAFWPQLIQAEGQPEWPAPFVSLGKGGIGFDEMVAKTLVLGGSSAAGHQSASGVENTKGDFTLRNNRLPSVEFLIQEKRAALFKRIFGIDTAREPRFSLRHSVAFQDSVRFMREILWYFGAEEAQKLIGFISLYTELELKAKDSLFTPPGGATEKKAAYARLSILVLKEILGNGKSYHQLVDSPKMGEFFNPPLTGPEKRARETYIRRVFYFWVSVFDFCFFSRSSPLISEAFDNNPTLKTTRRQSRLALGRAMAALMMARGIVGKRILLAEMGISFFQQELWLRSLVDAPTGEGQLSFRDEEIFRSMALTSPNTVLEKKRLRRLFLSIPARQRKPYLAKIMAEFNGFLDRAEKSGRVKSLELDRKRRESLNWFRRRTDEEKGRILEALAEKDRDAHFKDIFRPGEFRRARRHRGQMRDYGIKKVGEIISSIEDLISEYLESKPTARLRVLTLMAAATQSVPLASLFLKNFRHLFLAEIIANRPPDQEAAVAFINGAMENIKKNSPLFTSRILSLITTAGQRIKNGDSRLTKTEILKVLLASTKCQFDGPTFVDNFKTMFFEDLPELD